MSTPGNSQNLNHKTLQTIICATSSTPLWTVRSLIIPLSQLPLYSICLISPCMEAPLYFWSFQGFLYPSQEKAVTTPAVATLEGELHSHPTGNTSNSWFWAPLNMGETSKTHANVGRELATMQSYWQSPASPYHSYSRYWRINKIVHVVLSGGCWKDTLSNYWRHRQDIFGGLGLLVFTSRTTTKFIILSTKTNPETSPSQEGESTICTVQYNTTILGDIGTLSCLLQSPG